MARIVVTGGSGKAGRAVVDELIACGEDVLSADLVTFPGLPCEQVQADLTELGQVVEVLRGASAVVHLAAIPAPGLRPDELTFRVNTESTYNVFSAAATLGLERVVWASSETVLGLPFERERPAYAPIDEEHPVWPEFSYALSKLLSEEMARQFNRWTGIPFVGLRFSNIMEPHDYEQFPGFWDDPLGRKWNLWGYVDARDVALLALTVDETDEAFANVYSGAVSTQNLFPQIPQRALIVGASALATAGALAIDVRSYQRLLLLLGAVFVPLLGVLVAD